MPTELRLTREERSKVFAGSLHQIQRDVKPFPLEQGQRYIVSSTRGGRQIVDRQTGATVDIPAVPNLWITVKGWTLKRVDDPNWLNGTRTVWEISVAIVDERQPVRRLSMGAPSAAPRQGGLATRAGTKVVHREGGVVVTPKRVPKKGEEQERWTRETERGYGGSEGDQAVDDATLQQFAAVAEMPSLRAREDRRDEGALAAAERDVASELNVLNLSGARAAKRRAERAGRRLAAAA